MRKFVSTLCAAAITLGSISSGMTVAAAAPLNMPRVQAPEATSDVVDVQNRRGFYRQGSRYYYNGHRGYRDRRPGYRYHNGWWFPPAAFVLGAIVGGAINNANRPPAYGNAHVRWCQNRWRSYRAYDNTYQPYNGPRRQCVSPYS